jgi:phage terminase large subunit GpA-like protein
LTIENCKPLKELLGQKSGRRERDQTLRFLKFPGGYLASSGANSPGELSSRPARRIVGDEIGRWPLSAGEEGDPWGLLEARVTTFWNSLMMAGSTPTIEGECRITKLWENTDRGRWHVRCLHCDALFAMRWRDDEGQYLLRWERDDDGEPIAGTEFYACPHCGAEATEGDKPEMMARGGLHIERPEIVDRRGFRLDGLLSPWFTWTQMAQKFSEAKAAQDTLKTFINTRVGEAFAPPSERISVDGLMARAEPMPDLPPWVGAVTLGVDVQQDRFELLPVGWGAGERCAVLPPERIWGRIDAAETVTEAVEAILAQRSGMIPAAVCVDTGYRPEIAWAIVDRLRARRVMAYGIKGMDDLGRPIISEPSSKGRKGVRNPYLVGTNTVKDSIEARFRADPDGPKGVAFSDGIDAESFAQLTAEEKRVQLVNGRPRKVWKLRPGMRNEMLDMLGYAIGALHARGPRFLVSLGQLADDRAKAPPPPPEPAAPHDPYNPVVVPSRRPSRGFVQSWR